MESVTSINTVTTGVMNGVVNGVMENANETINQLHDTLTVEKNNNNGVKVASTSHDDDEMQLPFIDGFRTMSSPIMSHANTVEDRSQLEIMKHDIDEIVASPHRSNGSHPGMLSVKDRDFSLYNMFS